VTASLERSGRPSGATGDRPLESVDAVEKLVIVGRSPGDAVVRAEQRRPWEPAEIEPLDRLDIRVEVLDASL